MAKATAGAGKRTGGKKASLKAKNKASHTAHVAKVSGKNTSAFKMGNASTNPNRKAAKGNTNMRSKATINRLNMYRSRPDEAKRKAAPKVPMVRIEPDRRWFGNTRVLAQSKLQQFREEMSKSVDDPFNVVLKASKLPMSLLKDSEKMGKVNILQVESYADTFGPKKLRKKPKLTMDSLEGLAAHVDQKAEHYVDAQKHGMAKGKDSQRVEYDENNKPELLEKTLVSEAVFWKGTSKRIWGELYKVIDSSDVVIQVIDARDPQGTRNTMFERELRKNHPHKKLVLLLNKVDLIPSWAAKRWTAVLNKEFPTIAFHASITNPFGKAALIQLLRQFAQLLTNRQHVQIGLVGYPNVGKSSVINTLKMKAVCKSAPVPGETKCWQYISLTKRIFLIDCPGIVPPSGQDFSDDSAKVLKGVVRIERIENPSNYIPEVLDRVKNKYLLAKYGFPKDAKWEDHEDFLSQLARKMGKLLKGNNPAIETVAKQVLHDWQRGRIPFFVMPPQAEDIKEEEEVAPTGKAATANPMKMEDALDAVKAAPQAFAGLKCENVFDEEDTRVVEDDDVEAAEADKPVAGSKRKADEPAGKGPKGKKPKKARAKDVAPSAALDWNAVANEFAA